MTCVRDMHTCMSGLCDMCWGALMHKWYVFAQEAPANVMGLLRFTLEAISTYFRGIHSAMWLSKAEAATCVQASQNMTEPWPSNIDRGVSGQGCCGFSSLCLMHVRAHVCVRVFVCAMKLLRRVMVPYLRTQLIKAGRCSQCFQSFTCNKKSSASLGLQRPYLCQQGSVARVV